MRRRAETVVAGVVIAALAFAAVVSAQSNRWYDPYRRGLEAIERQNYDEAIVQLERAIAADARQSANKYVEGVFRTDYFPYYHLGIAYLRSGNRERALQNFNRASEGLNRNLSGNLTTLIAEAKTPVGPVVDPAFATALRQADTALAASRFQDALQFFDQARAADAAQYTRQNLASRRLEAARGRALELAGLARSAMPGSLSRARNLYDEAQRTFGGLQEVTDGLAEVARREQYVELRTGAEQDITANSFDAARQKLELARAAHAELFASDGLEARLGFVNERLRASTLTVTPQRPGPQPPGADIVRLFDEARKLEMSGRYREAEAGYASVVQRDPRHAAAAEALQRSRTFTSQVAEARALAGRDRTAARGRFEAARTLHPTRFDREGLSRELAALTVVAPPPPPVQGPGVGPTTIVQRRAGLEEQLREALRALVGGDAQRSIEILEPAVGTGANAAAYGYLGVAYAMRAMSISDGGESVALKARAIEQFRLALGAQPNFQLAPRLVSPKIIEWFNEARR